MAEVKIGDRVRVDRKDSHLHRAEGVVVETERYWCSVDIDGTTWSFYTDQLRVISKPQSYTRGDMVRAVLGQQWAVAVALWVPLYEWVEGMGGVPDQAEDHASRHYADLHNIRGIAALPSPVEVVAQIWGGE